VSTPEEIAKADPLDADPSLAGAPLNVRKARGLLFVGAMTAATVSGVYAYRRLHPTTYANSLVQRYRQLQELGPPADLLPDPKTTTPIDRMVARIESLAGDDRAAARLAARRAAGKQRT
jgi:hypothetical protein